jgi:two-component system cell cycle sensor histidine kinase/response regulator CckA
VAVVPWALWWPLLVAVSLPLLFGVLLVAGLPSRALASRLAVRSAGLLAAGFAMLVVFASLTVFHGGLEEVGERPPEGLAQLGDDLGAALRAEGNPVERLVPRLVLAQTADPRVQWAAIVRLECETGCIVAATPSLASSGAGTAAALEEVLAGAPRGVTRMATRLNGRTYLLTLGAVRDARGLPVAVVTLALDARSVVQRSSRLAWSMIGVVLVLLLLTSLLVRHGYAVTVADRVRGLIDQLAARRGEEDRLVGTPPTGAVRSRGDELQLLAERIDGWIERSLADQRARDEQVRALEAQLTQAQKMEAIGRLSGGIAHDFNNLLTVIRANVQLLEGEEAGGERRAIDDAAARGAALVRKLLAFSRADVLAPRPTPVSDLLDGISAVLRRVLPETIALDLPATVPPIAAFADATAFEQILLNIVVNARDAMPQGGRIAIELREGTPTPEQASRLALTPEAGYITVAVRDTGTGMAPEILERVFEPFFTTKPPESGSGLGLAIVYGMMRQQRGAVQVQSTPGEGTEVTLWFVARPLPAVDSVTDDTPPIELPTTMAGSGRILLVEDEEGVRRATTRALRKLGYEVSEAEHGAAALALLAADAEPFDLVVSDMMMPVMGGLELWRALRERQWSVPVLFISGYSTESISQATKGDPFTFTLSKPWAVPELSAAVRNALDLTRVAA